jgi:hypothetical protein
MKFKNVLVESQFSLIDKRLKIILLFLDYYVFERYQKELTITDLMRSQEEQDAIYAMDENYKIKPWKSVHQVGRGADVRTFDLPKNIIDDILTLLNTLPYDDKRKTAIHHDIGTGAHIHIQVKAR